MKTSAPVVLFFALFLAAPCARAEFFGFNFAAAAQPVGDRPLELEKSEWEGTWAPLGDAAALTVAVMDAAQGELQISYVDTDGEGKNPRLATLKVVIMRACPWVLFNISFTEDAKNCYFWGRIEINVNTACFWFADQRKLRALALGGKLQARHNKEGDLLESLTTDDLKALTSGELGVPFDWGSPVIYRRAQR